MLLALTMLPTTGLQSAYADEPAARPATTGGDVTLEGGAETAPVAAQREDDMYVADGLVYTVTDGGLAFAGFDGLPESETAPKEIVVPASIIVDGKDTSVAAVDIAEGQVAESATALTLPQSVNNVNTATLAAAFPNLAAIEIATPKASAPVAAGAAAIRAAYSSFGGVLYRNAWVATDGASQTTLAKELVWAPPAIVVARIPVECNSIAAGAFAGVKDLKTVVCFGVMEDIPQTQKADDGTVTPGAFTDEQIQTVNVIVPQTGTVVPSGDHVSASVAVTDDSTMDVKREAWWKSGFASDRITLGEVYGSTTNTLPVTEEGVLETAEAEVAYAPETTQNYSSRKAGIEPPESAIPTPVPDDDELDSSESGLVFTHLADMTLSVRWKGDPTATPAHIDIPAYAMINGVTYPVTEIAPHAFEDAVFLTSITIPETVKIIGESAFEGCPNLIEPTLPSPLKGTGGTMSVVTSPPSASSEENGANHSASSREAAPFDGSVSSYASFPEGVTGNRVYVSVIGGNASAVRFGNCSGISPSVASACVVNAFEHICVMDLNNGGENEVRVNGFDKQNSQVWALDIAGSNGWAIVSTSVTTHNDGSCFVLIGVVRDEAVGSSELALADHSHPDYLTASVANSLITLRKQTSSGTQLAQAYTKAGVDSLLGSGISASNTVAQQLAGKQDQIPANTYASYATQQKVLSGDAANDALKARLDELAGGGSGSVASQIESAFASIAYAGLDEVRNGSAFPGSFRKGSSPALPAPEREGREFLGWTFGDDAEAENATKDRASIEGYFKAATGDARLTAHWGEAEPDVSEAKRFFTSERPLRFDDASERQTHVIKVRLSNVPRTLASVSFEGDDRTRLLKETSGVELYVGSSEDALASGTRLPWEGSTGSGWTCELAELAEGSYGVYVGISVPTSAVDEASVPVSYTDGSYVASLVKMNYVFA